MVAYKLSPGQEGVRGNQLEQNHEERSVDVSSGNQRLSQASHDLMLSLGLALLF